MAKKTAKTAKKATKKAPTQSYNWDKLFDGKTHTLTKGKDFVSSERSLIVYAYNRARKMSKRIQIRQVKDGVMTIKALSPAEVKAIEKEKKDAAKSKRKAG